MAFQPESSTFDGGVLQWEITTPALGGVGGAANSPLLSLANRTKYLKDHIDALEAASSGNAPLNSPGFTGTPTAPTAALGDRTQKLANTTFVQDTEYSVANINVAGGANVVLTAVQAGVGVLSLSGLLTANISVIVPNAAKRWTVVNGTTGAFTVTVKTAAGTGVQVTQGRASILQCDATNVFDPKTDFRDTGLLGNPTAPTQPAGTNNTNLANTAFARQLKAGMVTVNVAGGVNVALTAAQWGVGLIVLQGALTANISVIVPDTSDQWVVSNQCSGAFTLTFRPNLGSGVEIPQATTQHLWTDGANVQVVSGAFDTTYAVVRKPTVQNPVAAEVLVGQTPSITLNRYHSLYGVDQGAVQIQVAAAANFAVVTWDSGTLDPQNFAQVPAGVLASNTGYFARGRYRDIEGQWSPWSDPVAFTTGAQVVQAPTLTAPANGAAGVGDGFTMTSSVFNMTTGVDTHAVTDWQIWTGPNGTGSLLWQSLADSSNKQSIAVPAGSIPVNTVCYPRVRYAGVNTGYSGWSAQVSFTTAASYGASLSPGGSFGGGFLAGYIIIGGDTFALVVAPKDGGEQTHLEVFDGGSDYTGSQSVNDGRANTLAMMASPQASRFHAARFCYNLRLGGFADWYLPSRDELEVAARNLKPTAALNHIGLRPDGVANGTNASSTPVGAAYTANVPAKTTVAAFDRTINGAQALGLVDDGEYWTSTFAATDRRQAWRQRLGNDHNEALRQRLQGTGNNCGVRAFRRVKVS